MSEGEKDGKDARVVFVGTDKDITLRLSQTKASWLKSTKTHTPVLNLQFTEQNRSYDFLFLNYSLPKCDDKIEVVETHSNSHSIFHLRIGDKAYRELIENGLCTREYNGYKINLIIEKSAVKEMP